MVTWVAIRIMHGNDGILLSIVRPYEMDITPSLALEMCKSLHLIITYLLKGEWKDLESKSQS